MADKVAVNEELKARISKVVRGMNTGETRPIIVMDYNSPGKAERIVFVTLSHDDSPVNPCKDGDGFGQIRSFSRRHIDNIDPTSDEFKALAKKFGADMVPLSYFEHGQSLWMLVSGHAPCGVEFQWDGVRFAGVWTPDKALLAEVKGKRKTERLNMMRKFAAQACETYTEWCNGSVYAYSVEAYKLRLDDDSQPYDMLSDYRRDTPLTEDSCSGIYGWEYFLSEAETVATKLPSADVLY